MKIKEKLDMMVGKLYMYEKENHRVLGWNFVGETVTITTDIGSISFLFPDADQKLSEFLKVEDSLAPISNNFEQYRPAVLGSVASELKDVLVDNIRKVQADKDFIPQAQAINDQAKSIIDLAKLEVEFIKAITYLKK